MSIEIKKTSFDSVGKLHSDDEDEFSNTSDTNSSSNDVDNETSDDFSKESSIKFSEHSEHELVLTEAHRSALEKKNAELTVEIKSESEKNHKLNRQLLDFLTKQGISCQRSDVEDQTAIDDYQSMLERLFGINEKYQQITLIMQERSATAMTAKQEKLEALELLQNEFIEMVTTAMSDPHHGSCPSEKVIAKLVKRFSKAYENTSLVRLEFLKAQNAFVELIETEKTLSNIGEGWKTLDYDNLTTEVQAVSSAIDIKQEQMEKLWSRYQNEVKALESLREELDGLQQSIKGETKKYDVVRAQEVSTLLVLQSLDEEKKNLKEKLNDLSHQAGILSRPPLMKHYDSVTDEIVQLSGELSELEALNAQLSGQNIKLKNKTREIKSSKGTFVAQHSKPLKADQILSKNSKLSFADCMQICKIDI